MLKPQPRILPGWARLFILISPAALLAALCWFLITNSIKLAAVIQIVAEANKAGLLKQPGIVELVEKAFGGTTSLAVLCITVVGVAILNLFLMIISARSTRAARTSN